MSNVNVSLIVQVVSIATGRNAKYTVAVGRVQLAFNTCQEMQICVLISDTVGIKSAIYKPNTMW